MLALSVVNHDRNLQIPIDDKAGGFDIKVGFDGAGTHEPATEQLVENARYGLAPYYGPGVPFGAGQLWAKKQPGGGMAVLLINHGGKSIDKYQVSLKGALNLTASSYIARDIWAQENIGTVAGNLSLTAAPYDSAFVLLTPAAAQQH
mmetsp:Transcript_56064/g.154110  ORF Transcript_56064/g.154110 Transcript_56064/m.154110 type:complete len:147 (+) Transcript_56064:1-441(+)